MEQMCLKRNAWHRKLNAYVYGKQYVETIDWNLIHKHEAETGKQWMKPYPKTDTQRNGCEYFWGTVLAVIGVAFVLMGKGLTWIIDNFPRREYRERKPLMSRHTKYRIMNVIAHLLLATTVVLYFIGGIYIGWAEYLFYHLIGIVAIAVVLGIIVLGIATQEGVRSLTNNYRKNHPKKDKEWKPKKPNALLTYLKAKKEKACPCICWED